MDWHSEVYIEDAAPVLIPSRSRLFALDPIGVGTADCEGLISYLVRLARAHSINARLLIRSQFDRYCGHQGGLRYANFFSDYARTLHGTGAYAKSFSGAAESLTTREGLQLLTMLPWRGIVPPIGNGLVAKRPRWCTTCLRESRESRHGAYFPLAWYLELGTACHRHGKRLNERCPWCLRQQPFFPHASYLDRCAYCNGWLGREVDLEASQIPEGWELWLAKAIADMIEHNADAKKYVSGEAFRELLSALVEERAQGKKGIFSQAMGMTKTTMSCWITKRQRPLLPQFLQLCHKLGMMPSEFFRMPQSSIDNLQNEVSLPLRLHRINRKFGLQMPRKSAIGQELKRITDDLGDYRSMAEVAGALGTTRGYLNYWFRDSCLAISARYKKHLNLLARDKCKIHQSEVRLATFRIYSSGIYPSRRKVHQAIKPLKLSLQRPELRASHKKALKDLQG